MSSPAYALPLRIERRPSRILAWAVVAVHASAVAVLVPLDLPGWLKLLVTVAVMFQAVITWRRHVSVSAAGAVREILWKADSEWELSYVDGSVRTARLRRAGYVKPALVVLRFIGGDGRRCAVLLPADGVDAEPLRRLRVGLRLHAEMV